MYTEERERRRLVDSQQEGERDALFTLAFHLLMLERERKGFTSLSFKKKSRREEEKRFLELQVD